MVTDYSYQLYRSIDDVDANEWREICHRSNNLFLDPRFLKAVEFSFSPEAHFWYAVYREDTGRAVAAACFSRYFVDGALMGSSAIQKVAAGVRWIWPRFLKYRIVLCGLPISTCDSQLAITDHADTDAILSGLNKAALEIARQSGCRLISFKEFSPELTVRMDGLSRYGFLKARSVYAYHLKWGHDSFSTYLASRRSRTRNDMKKSLRRFEEAGLTCEQLHGRDGVDRLFTPEVHQLYLNVLARAKVRFECVPLSYFQELARQLPSDSRFTVVRQGERIVGFCCGLAAADQHAVLFVGLDYSLNREADLYFNLIYRSLDQGQSRGVQVVHIGASADEFKQRIGCHGAWLSIYVKAVNSVSNLLLRNVFGLLFDTRDAPNAPLPKPPTGSRPRKTAQNQSD